MVVPGVIVVVLLAVGPVLRFVGRDIYTERVSVLWVLLAASAIQAVGFIPHFVLYANSDDWAIAGANFSGLVVGATTMLIATPILGASGAAIGFAVGSATMVVLKTLKSREVRKGEIGSAASI